MRGVQSTCGMILIMKFGRARLFKIGAGSSSRELRGRLGDGMRKAA